MLPSKMRPLNSHDGCSDSVRRSQPITHRLRNGSPGPLIAAKREVRCEASGQVTTHASTTKTSGGTKRDKKRSLYRKMLGRHDAGSRPLKEKQDPCNQF